MLSGLNIQNLKMMIVDDEPLMRQGLKVFFDWGKYSIREVIEAENSKCAIEIFSSKKPDIVISDIRMPEIDGLELIAKLKIIVPDTVFIIISGYSDFEYAKQAISLGVLHYLVKPINSAELHDVMLKCITKIEEQKHKQEIQYDLSHTLEIDANKPQKIINDIKCYLVQNLDIDISLKKLAEKYHYNPDYLSRLFKEETNSNYVDYVNKLRVSTAKNLIQSTDMMAYNICEKVGYKDYRYFVSVFRKFTGMTPSEFKKSRRAFRC